MAIQGSKSTAFGDEYSKAYLRVLKSNLEHWLDGVIRLKMEYGIWKNKKARTDGKEPFETKLIEVTLLPEEIEQNIISLSYTRLKLLEEFNNWEDC